MSKRGKSQRGNDHSDRPTANLDDQIDTRPSMTNFGDPLYNQEEEMLEEVAKEKYYFGLTNLRDVEEVLVKEGDFAVRAAENDLRKLELVIRTKEEVKVVPFKFVPLDGTTLSVTLDGSFTSTKGIADLITHHLTMHLAIDQDSTTLSCGIRRPVWQLKKDCIKPEVKIGEGAFGTVWKGLLLDEVEPNKKDPKKVAIKLSKLCEENRLKMEEMQSEARLMRGLNHPNVVQFYGLVSEPNEITIVMEYVDCGSLDAFIRENGKSIQKSERTKYCYDICLGLTYLHDNRICHRDLAARNCLISKARRVKISDFGMSKQCEQYHMQPNERAPIRWQAPEVILTAIYTKPSDVYSLGMIFYEIFAGEKPFEGHDNKEIRTKIKDPAFRPKIPKEMPKFMMEILVNVWQAEPKKRLRAKDIVRMMHFHKKTKKSSNLVKAGDRSDDRTKKTSNLKKKSTVSKTKKDEATGVSKKMVQSKKKRSSDLSKK